MTVSVYRERYTGRWEYRSNKKTFGGNELVLEKFVSEKFRCKKIINASITNLIDEFKVICCHKASHR